MDESVVAPQSVLIIDDDRALLSALVQSLQHLMPMRILSAESAVAGLDIVNREHPTCVVVDVMLPGPSGKGMDGFQFVQIIRGDPQTAATPVVFLTARAEDINRFAGLAVGGDNYLVKPVPLKILVGAIEKAIATSDTERRQRLQRLAESEPPRSAHD
ncbi:MAG: response regulator [Ktedonobacterales bacterium]|nr:response regulator [Ktedonobacterales bacterium]